MITEKELRTGNLYATIRNQEIVVAGIDTVNKFIIVTTASNTEIISKNETSIIFEDLNSIELTPKSFQQLGFMDNNGTMSIDILSDNKTRFVWNEKLGQVCLVDGNGGIIGQQIKYVHQLQNVYYYLTGQELPLQ